MSRGFFLVISKISRIPNQHESFCRQFFPGLRFLSLRALPPLYAIRYVTKENIRIRNNKMGEAISNNNDRVLWDEVKKMSKTSNNLPTTIDGKNEVEEISYIFAEKYDILYNSVSYNLNDLNRLTTDIAKCIDNSGTNSSHTISVKQVKDALFKLKLGKKEENGLFSNHFIYGSDRLIVMITLLFNSM